MKKFFIFIGLVSLLFTYPKNAYSQTPDPRQKILAFSKTDLVVESDTRARILREYLNKYNSPLADFAPKFVKEADKNNIDWRLLVAIGGLESTFGHQILPDSYNAWGWGIYGNNAIYFKSWNEAIETISKGLKENYINKLGTDNVYAIGRMYAASPTWAQRVEYFLNRIDDFEHNNPKTSLSLTL